MTAAMVGTITQDYPGAPIRASMTVSGTGSDTLPVTLCMAASATNVLPNPLSAAAGHEGGTQPAGVDPFWDSQVDNEVFGSLGGVQNPGSVQQRYAKFLRLDSTFTVGRYAWIIGTADNPVAGSSVPTLHSGPYLIR